MTTRTTTPEAIFHPVEHAILSDWLGRPRPECVRYIGLYDCWEQACAETSDPWASRAVPEGGHVRLRPPEYEGYSDLYDERDNAVARICLERVQQRLPQWSTMHADGCEVVTRRYDSTLPRDITLLPQHILEINWASSGPGYSWPETYYVTFLPFYEVHVVTASRDSAEVNGYLDGAIAWFGLNRDFRVSVEDVLKGFWAQHLKQWEQQRWECVFAPGLVSEERARALADEVWAVELHGQI